MLPILESNDKKGPLHPINRNTSALFLFNPDQVLYKSPETLYYAEGF